MLGLYGFYLLWVGLPMLMSARTSLATRSSSRSVRSSAIVLAIVV